VKDSPRDSKGLGTIGSLSGFIRFFSFRQIFLALKLLYVVNDEQVLLVLDKIFKRLGEKLAVLH